MATIFDSKKIQRLFGAEERIETLISELFFTPKNVYKIKRAVKFDFADFTDPELRFKFAQKEFEKNKKFAPEIHLKKIPIYLSDGEPNLSGKGKKVEIAIKMVRLPDNSSLDSYLRAGKVTKVLAEKIGKKIAVAHAKLKMTKKSKYLGSPKELKRIWDETLGLLEKYLTDLLLSEKEYSEIAERSKKVMEENIEDIDERNKKGYCREIHGDMHSENVFIKEGVPFIIDSALPVEDWENGDLAKDLGAIAMDFDAFGQAKSGDILVDRYQELRNDKTIRRVLPFFKIYWAAARMWVYGLIYKEEKSKKALKKFEMYKKTLLRYLEDQA
jgi:aminoglycoside phosphotransferase family enzyme